MLHRCTSSSSIAPLAIAALAAVASAQQWREEGLRASTGHALVHDLARGRTILFGGTSFDSNNQAHFIDLVDTWEHDGRAWSHVRTAHAPPPRDGALAVFDLQRARVVLYGGRIETATKGPVWLTDTWEYDGIDWTQHVASTPNVAGGTMVYHAAIGRTLLMGPVVSGAPIRTWDYDGLAWRLRPTATALPTRPSSAAYDLVRARTVAILPWTTTGGLAETWEYDGIDWRHARPTVSPDDLGPATYDLIARRVAMVCYFSGRVWLYDGVTWTANASANTPLTSTVVFDVANARLLTVNSALPMLMTTWAHDANGWTAIDEHREPIDTGHIVMDTVAGHARMFANRFGSMLTWNHDSSGWTPQMPALAVHPSTLAPKVFDAARARTISLEMSSVNVSVMDTWEYDGTNWTVALRANEPPNRSGYSLVHDSRRRRSILFGGARPFAPVAEHWEHDGVHWSPRLSPTTPPPRTWPSMSFDAGRGRVVLFGGGASVSGPLQVLADTWEYDGDDWHAVPTVHAPSGRTGSAFAYDAARGRTILFGGLTAAGLAEDTWEYDGRDWTQLAIPGPPARLAELVYDAPRQRMLLVSTRTTTSRLGTFTRNTTWELLPPATASWARYGTGCASAVSSRTPTLDGPDDPPPKLGCTIALELAKLPLRAGAAVLAFGTELGTWQGHALPFALDAIGLPHCDLWLAPFASTALLHAGDHATFALTIPNAPPLRGIALAVQAITLDPLAANGIDAATNGVILRIR